MGLAVPKGTPKAIVDEISDATRKALAAPSLSEKLLNPFAFEPLGETPEQFSKMTNKRGAKFSLNGATALGVVPKPGDNVAGAQLGIRHLF